MIIEDTKKIMKLLDANYNILDSDDNEKNKIKINIWHKVLQYYTFADVGKACGSYINNTRITPKPSDIKAELEANQAKRHSVYKQVSNQQLECEAKLTKQNLQQLCNREFAPFLNMNLSNELRYELIEKHNQANIDEFVSHIWAYVMHTDDFQIYHAQMALADVRGTNFTFKEFMKALMNAHDTSQEIARNPNKIEACKQFLYGNQNQNTIKKKY